MSFKRTPPIARIGAPVLLDEVDQTVIEPDTIPSLSPASAKHIKDSGWPLLPGAAKRVPDDDVTGAAIDATSEDDGDVLDWNEPIPKDPALLEDYMARLKAAVLAKLGVTESADVKATLARADAAIKLAETPMRERVVPLLGKRATREDAKGATEPYPWDNPPSPGKRLSGEPFDPLPVPMSNDMNDSKTLTAALVAGARAALAKNDRLTPDRAMSDTIASRADLFATTPSDVVVRCIEQAKTQLAKQDHAETDAPTLLPGAAQYTPRSEYTGKTKYTFAHIPEPHDPYATGGIAPRYTPPPQGKQPLYGTAAMVADAIGAEWVPRYRELMAEHNLNDASGSDRAYACRLVMTEKCPNVFAAKTLEEAQLAYITEHKMSFSESDRSEALRNVLMLRGDLARGDCNEHTLSREDRQTANAGDVALKESFDAVVLRFIEAGETREVATQKAQAVLVAKAGSGRNYGSGGNA